MMVSSPCNALWKEERISCLRDAAAILRCLRHFPFCEAFQKDWHGTPGKISECGTMAAETMGKGVLFGTVRRDHFVIRPIGPGLKGTPQSVAAHSLYENADPYLHQESSGTLDLSKSTYEKVDDISVRIAGSAFIRGKTYSIKLEGAELVGYQSLIVGGNTRSFVIKHLDSWLAGVRERIEAGVTKTFAKTLSQKRVPPHIHIYGRDGVMGGMEPDHTTIPSKRSVWCLRPQHQRRRFATTIALLSRQPLLHNPVRNGKVLLRRLPVCIIRPISIGGLCTGSISIMLPCLTTRKRCSE